MIDNPTKKVSLRTKDEMLHFRKTVCDNLTQRLQVKCLFDEIKKTGNPKSKTILETGCGYGFFSEKTAKLCKKLYATDLYDCFPDKLKKNNIKYSAKVDATRLPFKNNTFDLVYNVDIVEHIEDDAAVIREGFRVLKKGGTLIVGTPNKNRLSLNLLRLLGKKIDYPMRLGDDPYYGEVIHLREYTEDELLDLFRQSGSKYKVKKMYYLTFGVLGKFEIECPRFLRKYCQFLYLVAEKI